MATRTRDSVAGREKRGTSPSQVSQTGGTTHRKAPVVSKTSSAAHSHDSTTVKKQVPNYLRPTLSSVPEGGSKQQGKKPVTSDGAQKPAVMRRRSFDKPPSPTQPPKTRVSPSPTIRYSSFSGKTSTSPRPVPERNLKVLRDGGKQRTPTTTTHGATSTLKKCSIYVKKQGTPSGTSTVKEQVTNIPEKAGNLDTPEVPEPETQAENKTSPVMEAEEQTTRDGVDHEKNTEDPALGDHEPINNEQSEPESDQDANIVPVESPTVLEQEDVSVKTEEPEEQSHVEETTNEITGDNAVETAAVGANEEVKEKEEEKSTTLDEKEHLAVETEAHESKGTEMQEVVEEEKHETESTAPEEKKESIEEANNEKQEPEKTATEEAPVAENTAAEEENKSENPAPKPVVIAHGKKEAVVSNDVVEETAKKLREQRKNKVKALAGAFETVISLQEK